MFIANLVCQETGITVGLSFSNNSESKAGGINYAYIICGLEIWPTLKMIDGLFTNRKIKGIKKVKYESAPGSENWKLKKKDYTAIQFFVLFVGGTKSVLL